MWQICNNPDVTKNGTIAYFRPHQRGNNQKVLASFPVNSVIPDTDEGRAAWYRMRIEVRKPEGADDVLITTAIRPMNGTFVTVDENRSVGAGRSLKRIGFRENSGSKEAA
jgi:hypothetical protein